MAYETIAYSAVASGANNAVTSLTFSHTCSGTNRYLLVGIDTRNTTSDKVSGVTYAGVAMSRITTITTSGSRTFLYGLANPALGANNVIVSLSSSNDVRAISASYTGVAQNITFTAGTATNNSINNLSVSLTTTVVGSWLAGFCRNGTQASTAGANTTNRTTSNEDAFGDSNGGKNPVGSYSLAWTNAFTSDMSIVACILVPATKPTGGNPMFLSSGGLTLG